MSKSQKEVKKSTKVYQLVADTESNTEPDNLQYGDVEKEYVRRLKKNSRVWATSMTPIDDNIKALPLGSVWVTNCLTDFFTNLDKLPKGDVVIYFHNLTWDVYFFMIWLIREAGFYLRGEKYITGTDKWSVRDGQLATLCNSTGTFYKFSFRWHGRNVEFRDSYKLLPFSVDKIAKSFQTKHQKLKGTVDYGIYRPEGYQITEKERKYVENDVLVVAEALKMLDHVTPEWRQCLTIGSMCMREYKQVSFFGKTAKARNNSYRAQFPQLSFDADKPLRNSYFGGWCYVNPKYQGKEVTAGNVYDVNSLYPWAMHNHRFPMGHAHKIDNSRLQELVWQKGKDQFPFIVEFEADYEIKPGKFPFIQKDKTLFRETSHVTKSDEDSRHRTMTRPDFELFLECYDVTNLQVLNLWTFDYVDNPFDKYIDKWYEVKQQATKDGDRVLRQFAKLMLNNLYGKFAQRPVGRSKNFYVDDDGILCSTTFEEDQPGGYIPVGAYITAYARCKTVRAANANYDTFCYSDTDSIHLCNGDPKQVMDYQQDPETGDVKLVPLEIDKVKLGAWDNESKFSRAKFVRQKTYIELDREEKNFIIRAAGCPQACKDRMLYKVTDDNALDLLAENINPFHPLERDDNESIISPRRSNDEIFKRFDYGLCETGKLRIIKSDNGHTMIHTTFAIKHVTRYAKMSKTKGDKK